MNGSIHYKRLLIHAKLAICQSHASAWSRWIDICKIERYITVKIAKPSANNARATESQLWTPMALPAVEPWISLYF